MCLGFNISVRQHTKRVQGVQEQHYFPCIHCLSICPSGCLRLNHLVEFNNLATSHPLMVRVCESSIFFSVRPSICASASAHLSITPLDGINQTCYITSPHGKGMQEQHYFSVKSVLPCICGPSVCLSCYLLLNH